VQKKVQFIYELSCEKSQLQDTVSAAPVSTDEQNACKKARTSTSTNSSKHTAHMQQIESLKDVLMSTMQPPGPMVPRTLDEFMQLCSFTDEQKARTIAYLSLPVMSGPTSVHAALGVPLPMSQTELTALGITQVQANIWRATLANVFPKL
jgi:hypothetical protein